MEPRYLLDKHICIHLFLRDSGNRLPKNLANDFTFSPAVLPRPHFAQVNFKLRDREVVLLTTYRISDNLIL